MAVVWVFIRRFETEDILLLPPTAFFMENTMVTQLEDKPNTKITALEISNVQRISAVHIEPDGSMIVIGGENGEGKTSVLDSIEMALGGKDSVSQRPLKDGEKKGYVILETESLVITRTFTEKSTNLVIKDKQNGLELKSPQSILNKLTGELTFDPLEFSRMKKKDRNETLINLSGLDLTALDSEIEDLSNLRLIIGREEKSLSAKLAGMQKVEEVPDEEISVTELANLLAENNEIITEYEKKKVYVEQLASAYTDTAKRAEELEAELAECISRRDELMKEGKALKEDIASMQVPDVSAINSKMAKAEEINVKVRNNKDYDLTAQRAKEKATEYAGKTKEIDQKRMDKDLAIKNANMPIEGLSLGDDGVIFNGIPFDQCSGAEKLRISVAMGIALNPELKVLLIRDGSLLDQNSLGIVGHMANQNGMQVWLEKVSDGAECSVIIEDGKVKS